MTNETLQGLLDAFNGGVAPEIIIRPIGKKVWWGFAWMPSSGAHGGHQQEAGYEMFFVQAAKGEFVAAVFWHGPDELHWYVTEKHRRKGILVKPLRTVILPFIFHRHHRPKQRCSVEARLEHQEASTKLAKRVGFREVSGEQGKRQFEMRADDAAPLEAIPRSKPTAEELEQLWGEAERGLRSVRMAIDRLEIKFGDRISREKLEALRSDLNDGFASNWTDCLEDAKWSLEEDPAKR
jgi:hypothetical protein